MITRSDALDDALDRLDGYGYLDAPGFTTHGPMGAETLTPSRAAETALPDDGATPAPAEIIGRAAEHRDTHAIKFTEACVPRTPAPTRPRLPARRPARPRRAAAMVTSSTTTVTTATGEPDAA